jgi:group II intron reverse transcriptase/maturase
MKSVKRQGGQMSLFDTVEWHAGVAVLSGKGVPEAAKGRADEWLTDCYEERTSTVDLMSSVADLPNLSQACRRVIQNGGAGGVDGMEVVELREWFSANHEGLRTQLLSGNYHPSAVRGVKIPKPNGGERQLGIPTVVDRVVQQAIHQVLNPRYERVFSKSSYGFRLGKGARQALRQAGEYVGEGYKRVVDIDLAKFFDEVNHSRLLWRLSTRIGDKRLLKLIHRFLKAGMLEGGLLGQRVKGTPQGGPLSPLLSNIVLDELDKELERRGHRFVRYADDLIVLVASEKSARRVYDSLVTFIEDKLKLRVNREKSEIRRSYELNFLGHGILGNGSLMLSAKSEKRLKDKLRQTTRRNRGRSFAQVIKELNQQLRGWLEYFRYAMMKGKLRAIESWLKHRLRCYRLKQCKRAIGMFRFLFKLGVPRDRSWSTASNRRGWWVNASTPAAHEGMNNEWFLSEGLLAIVPIYARLHA